MNQCLGILGEKTEKSEHKSRAQTVLSEGNILHLSDYEYKSLLEKQQAHCSKYRDCRMHLQNTKTIIDFLTRRRTQCNPSRSSTKA